MHLHARLVDARQQRAFGSIQLKRIRRVIGGEGAVHDGHGLAAVVQQGARAAVLYTAAGAVTVGRYNLLRLAKQPVQQVHLMAAQIGHRAAARLRRIKPVLGQHAVERLIVAVPDAHGGDGAQQAAVRHLFCKHEGAGGAADVGDGEGDVVALNGFLNLQRVLMGQRQALFHKHVLAGIGGSDDDFLVHEGGRGNDNAFNFRVLPHLVEVCYVGNRDFPGPCFAALGVFIPYADHAAVGRGQKLRCIARFMRVPAAQNGNRKHRVSSSLGLSFKADASVFKVIGLSGFSGGINAFQHMHHLGGLPGLDAQLAFAAHGVDEGAGFPVG